MSSKKKKAKKLAKKMAKQAAKKKMKPRKKQLKKVDSWKRKEWYTVVAPKMFEEKFILETPAAKPEVLIGRIVEIPLRDFTNKIQHQTIIIKLKINEVKGKTAYTEPVGFELLRDALRRDIRRRRSAVQTILNLETKDNRKIRITFYVFTAQKIDTLKQKRIRKAVDEHLKTEIPQLPFSKFFEMAIYGEIASSAFKVTKNYQKIKKCEIYKVKVLS